MVMSMCTLYPVNLKRERHNKTLEISSRDFVFIYRAIIDRASFTLREQSTEYIVAVTVRKWER